MFFYFLDHFSLFINFQFQLFFLKKYFDFFSFRILNATCSRLLPKCAMNLTDKNYSKATISLLHVHKFLKI